MDADAELRKAKWLLIAGAAFCVSGCFSLSELNYLVRGETAAGTITEVLDTDRGRPGRRRAVRLVKFRYEEADGTRRKQDAEFPPGWPPPGGEPEVPVRYVPGSEYSGRIAGTGRVWPLWVFGGSLLALGWFGWRLSREANAPPPRRPLGRTLR